MTRSADHLSRLSAAQRVEVEQRIEAFARAWQKGERPAIAEHLPADPVRSTPVSDLSPLAGMKLINFRFVPKNITKGMDAIRQMKSLQEIGTGWSEQEHFSPEEFWKKYDAGEFGK